MIPKARVGPPLDERTAPEQATSWSSITRNLPFLLKLALAALVVHLYAIEGPAFFRVFIIATAGFTINVVLPMKYRLPFFVFLSFSGVFIVFGISDGAWLLGCGLTLIGLCQLPCRFAFRVLALIAYGGLLAAFRSGMIGSPLSSVIWPILGSMFMFRLVLYMLAIRRGRQDRDLWGALAYFFLLPNITFPLFPVVDYQTFRKTYYDRNEASIYQQGLGWISRGLVHLVLYRLVYHNLLNDSLDVVGLGDLVQFMLGTLLLYLRVSGQFHLIVGLLHMFGFRLPETHKLYYLAHSFTELWRRINIYWTEFMMKVVFYPTYFRLKRLGPARAMSLSTLMVFAATWVLHSYQWFWLRGGFPVTLQDGFFWGVLGALVITTALRELKPGSAPKQRVAGWSWKLGLRAATTFCLFCFLWSLWSTDSLSRWIWMLGAAANIDAKGVILLALTFVTVMILGGREWDVVRSAKPKWIEIAIRPSTRTIAPLVLLLAAALPVLQGVAPKPVAAGLRSLQTTGLNARDAALKHRGYYEELFVGGQLDTNVLDVIGRRSDGWKDISTIGVLRERQDFLLRDLHPSQRVMWNGNTFSTNRWGMRDKEYTLEKPEGTLRIALLGPSHVMGNGVADADTFESLLEERLNREFRHAKYRNIEILNFGVDGYPLTQQIAILEDRVFNFSPDIVIATHYQRNRSMTERFLLKVIWGDIAVPHEPLRALLASAGLAEIDRGMIPVPFPVGRRLAKWLGIQPRMPSVEAESRVRWIADDVLEWSFRRFAEVMASRGVIPVVLGLNAVIDDVPSEIPNRRVILESGLPVLDLFNVFPVAERPALRVAPRDDHPNAAGHRLIADRLYMEFVTLFKSGALESHQFNESKSDSTNRRRF